MGTNELLDLSVLAPERPSIRIRTPERPDGKLYELVVKDELSTQQLASLARTGQKAMSFNAHEDPDRILSAMEADDLSDLLDSLLSVAFADGKYDEIRDLLTVFQKVKIVETFSVVCMGVTAPVQTETSDTP